MSGSTSLRYARQYTLAEIGTTGQQRLEASTVRAGSGDARAAEVALAYLTRAGVRLAASGEPVEVADTGEIARMAGRAELIESAAFLAGALAAVRHIAVVVGAPARPLANVPALAGGSPEDRA